MREPLPDSEFYSDHGRHTLGLGHFWLFNPHRSRRFRAVAILIPMVIAVAGAALVMWLAAGVEAG